MPYEIVNSKRSKSVITVTGNTATRINLSQLSTNTSTETVTAASIATVITATDGTWNIYRGNDNTGTLVLQLVGNNYLPLTQGDISIANTSTANIYVTNSGTAGTLIIQLSKVATFTTDLDAA
jgi:hypothetical protein